MPLKASGSCSWCWYSSRHIQRVVNIFLCTKRKKKSELDHDYDKDQRQFTAQAPHAHALRARPPAAIPSAEGLQPRALTASTWQSPRHRGVAERTAPRPTSRSRTVQFRPSSLTPAQPARVLDGEQACKGRPSATQTKSEHASCLPQTPTEIPMMQALPCFALAQAPLSKLAALKLAPHNSRFDVGNSSTSRVLF